MKDELGGQIMKQINKLYWIKSKNIKLFKRQQR